MSITITRKLEIDAGHRLLNHEGKCAHIHGHRYMFEVTVTAPNLDDVGRIVDFGQIKTLVGGWLDDELDHGFIVQEGDPLIAFLTGHSQKHYIMPMPPTAENLARAVLDRARVLLQHPLEVVMVRCHETPNCYATAQ